MNNMRNNIPNNMRNNMGNNIPNNMRENLRYNIPIENQRALAQKYTQQPTPIPLNKTNRIRKDMKNHPKTSKKKYKGNIKAKIFAGLLSLSLVGGAIGINQYKEELNEMYSYDLQANTETSSELHNVLENTDLDELLNEYLAAPSKDNKEQLLTKLKGRDSELAKLNLDLIEASLADSLNISKDEVSIKALFKHLDEKNGNDIMKGTGIYRGHTLRITTDRMSNIIEAYKNVTNGTYNYTYISKDLFDLISNAKFNYIAPESSYYQRSKSSRIERAIETYKDLKEILNEKDFTIYNNRILTLSRERENER